MGQSITVPGTFVRGRLCNAEYLTDFPSGSIEVGFLG